MDLRYPIGPFKLDESITTEKRQLYIEQIAETPAKLRAAVDGLSSQQLDTPYRPGGWTVRQVVHHLPDSHLNSYIRFKLAMTEDEPTIKPYHEDRWAQLEDARTAPVATSLSLLESLHSRWILFLRSLTPEDFGRTFQHPEMGLMNLEKNLCLYAWHGRHHVAQINSLRERLRWH